MSPTLEARAGTGGNNQPIVAYSISSYHSNAMKSGNPHSGVYVADTARTLDAMHCGYPGCNQGGIAVVEPFQTYQKVTGPLMANSHPGSYTGQDAFSDMLEAGVFCPETGGNDPSRSVAFQEELSPTLRAGCTPAAVIGNTESPIVLDRAFFNQGQNAQYDPQYYTDGTVPTLIARGPAADCCSADCRNATEYPELNGTPQAKANGGFSYNCNQVVRVQYIVRRLTPTECARLQGFPDFYGHPDVKTELTDDEYQFWLNVRNTHAAINGKATKDYTKDQILKWYNGLHTDSSEYKMWGNGIALPNALYVMQGIADVMSEEKSARRKWLDDLLGDCL